MNFFLFSKTFITNEKNTISGTRMYRILGNAQNEKQAGTSKILTSRKMCCSVGGISLPKEKYDKRKSSKTHVMSVVGYFICYYSKPSLTVMIDKVVNNSIATKLCKNLPDNRYKSLNFSSARYNSMTKLCCELFKC